MACNSTTESAPWILGCSDYCSGFRRRFTCLDEIAVNIYCWCFGRHCLALPLEMVKVKKTIPVRFRFKVFTLIDLLMYAVRGMSKHIRVLVCMGRGDR